MPNAIAADSTSCSKDAIRIRSSSRLTRQTPLNSCPRRDRSTTPLQALTLLNDPVFFEAVASLGGTSSPGKERECGRAHRTRLSTLSRARSPTRGKGTNGPVPPAAQGAVGA